MKSFETITVNTFAFFELTFWNPLKLLFPFYIIAFIIFILCKSSFAKDNTKFTRFLPYALFLFIKSFLYGVLFFLIFFFDFSSHTWSPWKFPEEMLLSSAFVGIFAGYEAISGILSILQEFISTFSE